MGLERLLMDVAGAELTIRSLQAGAMKCIEREGTLYGSRTLTSRNRCDYNGKCPFQYTDSTKPYTQCKY